jgi:hypothetical protein
MVPCDMDTVDTKKCEQTDTEKIEIIKAFISSNPSWNRRRLSIELATRWDWRAPNGALRDMACRQYLLKLHRRGSITLPNPQRPSNNDHSRWKIPEIAHNNTPIHAPLAELQPLHLCLVRNKQEDRLLIKCLIDQYHYLGYRGSPGETLSYLIYDRHQRLLACLVFGAAAWSGQARDRFIGWDPSTRRQNLFLIVNNQRFLILPWVQSPSLASHILSLVCKRLSSDYLFYFNHPVYLVETFIDSEKFLGTCYRAANWIYLGQTKGRTRNDRFTSIKAPIKNVYVHPLNRRFKKSLCQTILDSQ